MPSCCALRAMKQMQGMGKEGTGKLSRMELSFLSLPLFQPDHAADIFSFFFISLYYNSEGCRPAEVEPFPVNY